MSPTPASADSLRDALISTYRHHPDFLAAQARLRATEEQVAQAGSQFLPQVELDGGARLRWTRTDLSSTGGGILSDRTNPFFVEVRLSQLLYDWNATSLSVEKARKRTEAQAQVLRSVEQGVMYGTVEAYMRYLEARQIRAVRRDEIAFLRGETRNTRDRETVGSGSGADAAQARARLAAAETGLNAAEAQLAAWAARYVRSSFLDPSRISGDIRFRGGALPASFDEALELAAQRHPAVIAAQHNVDALDAAAGVTQARRMPRLSLEGRVKQSWDDGSDDAREAYVGLRLAMPLTDGGLRRAQAREAVELLAEADMQLHAKRNEVRGNMRIVWADHLAANRSIEAARRYVEAQNIALTSIQSEERIGARTRIDVLNAQSELVTARINLIQARAQHVISSYGILAAMGELDAASLGLPVD